MILTILKVDWAREGLTLDGHVMVGLLPELSEKLFVQFKKYGT